MKQTNSLMQIIIAMLLTGTAPVIVKLATQGMPVYLFITLALILAVFLISFVFLKQQKFTEVKTKVLGRVIAIGFIGVFLYRVTLYNGLQLLNASEAGIILSLTAGVTAILGMFLNKEKVSTGQWLGVLLSVIGVAILAWGIIRFSGVSAIAGIALVLGTVLCGALFNVYVKDLSDEIDSVSLALVVTIVAAISIIPLGVYDLLTYDMKSISLSGWYGIFHIGVFVTVLPFLLWFKGAQNISTTMTGILNGLVPVSTVLFSYILLNESFQITHIVGLALILLSIVVSIDKTRTKRDDVPR